MGGKSVGGRWLGRHDIKRLCKSKLWLSACGGVFRLYNEVVLLAALTSSPWQNPRLERQRVG